MNIKQITAVCLAALMLCGSLTACQNKEASVTDTVQTAPAPLSAKQMQDYTDDPETAEKIDLLRATFAELLPSPEMDFDVAETENGVTVTGYRGTATAVRIPESVGGKPVTSIGDGAFANNTALTALYLPNSVTAIGTGILAGCTALSALRTPILGNTADTQYLGALFGATQYIDNPIHVPPSLAYLELGETVTALADHALFDCNDLVCVTLPAEMTKIGSYALYSCTSLVAINTKHLTALAPHALDSCSSLTHLEFGEQLTSIGLGALEGCIGLRRMTLPFVGGSATENTYLGYVFGATVPEFAKGYYPPYLAAVTLLSTCQGLGDCAFLECDSLTSVTLPEGLTTVGIRAFANCTRLAAVTLPNSVTAICENAFLGCLSLSNITFGSALASIGINAFYNCISLTDITLPQGLTALPASCFAGCIALKQVDLGGVQTVGKNAFHNCTALVSVNALPDVDFEDGNEAARGPFKQAS